LSVVRAVDVMKNPEALPAETRWKITDRHGRFFYVYASTSAKAQKTAEAAGLTVIRIREDTEPWETKLQDVRKAPGA
jgi:hypothetical protein